MLFPINAPMFDLLVLAVVEKQETYGYQISQIVKPVAGTKDSALYPVLKRLQEREYLTVYDQPFQGRNRRYYRITEKGRAQYHLLSNEWDSYKTAIDDIIQGGAENE